MTGHRKDTYRHGSTSQRLIPTTPLEVFYRSLRRLTGSKEAKYRSLCNLLNDRHGPTGSAFLAELFCRSVHHAEFYANIDEAFYPDRPARNSNEPRYARQLVKTMRECRTINLRRSQL